MCYSSIALRYQNIPLNDTGIKQDEALRENVKDVKSDVAYISPLKRTAKTAEIAVGDRSEIIYDDRLVERSFGFWRALKLLWTT